MAAYSYKDVIYRDDFRAAIKPAMEEIHCTADDYDGNPSYDGDCWRVADYLLRQKDERIAELEAELAVENAELRETIVTKKQRPAEMSDEAFFNLLVLLMEADPWPFNADRVVIEQFLDSEANKRGYADWIEAYHLLFQVSRAIGGRRD